MPINTTGRTGEVTCAVWCCVSWQVRGPPAKAAFDAAGKPTKALEGFCRKNGASVDAVLREADAKGVEYCWVEVKDAGKPAAEVGDMRIVASADVLAVHHLMRSPKTTVYYRMLCWVARHGALSCCASMPELPPKHFIVLMDSSGPW